MLASNQTTDVIIVDSKDDPRYVFVIVDQCRVPVIKVKLKDTCYVLRLVGNACHLDLDLSDCENN